MVAKKAFTIKQTSAVKTHTQHAHRKVHQTKKEIHLFSSNFICFTAIEEKKTSYGNFSRPLSLAQVKEYPDKPHLSDLVTLNHLTCRHKG